MPATHSARPALPEPIEFPNGVRWHVRCTRPAGDDEMMKPRGLPVIADRTFRAAGACHPTNAKGGR